MMGDSREVIAIENKGLGFIVKSQKKKDAKFEAAVVESWVLGANQHFSDHFDALVHRSTYSTVQQEITPHKGCESSMQSFKSAAASDFAFQI